MRALLRALLLAAAPLLGSCALLSKSELQTARYFTPASSANGGTSPASRLNSAPRSLRLGRITSSAHLRERMVYRDARGRVSYDEERRWTERPETYLRRALSRALFEERNFRRSVTGTGPSLDVELVAFEELRGQEPVARLEAVILLEDGQASLFEQTLVVERPIAPSAEGERDDAVVLALSEALHQAVAQIADRVATAMAAAPAPQPAALQAEP
jgi:cholesterol transport system auxiliary component